MNITIGTSVDLIHPFPAAEAARIYGWKHCYRTTPEDDDAPKDREEFTAVITEHLNSALTCGIIDKGQLTSTRHEAPLVGMLTFTLSGGRDGVLNFACGRKAFKLGLLEESLRLYIPAIFAEYPYLLRISLMLDESNTPAKAVLRKCGFRYEGLIRDAVMQGGVPQPRVLFGLTRQESVLTSVESSTLPISNLEEMNGVVE